MALPVAPHAFSILSVCWHGRRPAVGFFVATVMTIIAVTITLIFTAPFDFFCVVPATVLALRAAFSAVQSCLLLPLVSPLQMRWR